MPSDGMIRIRPYRAGDLDAVIDIFLRAVRETASRDYAPEEIDAWAQADRAEWDVWRREARTFVAEVEGAPAGFSDLEADGHLDMMFVHPRPQGRGVATVLLARIEAEARALSLPRLFTEASLTARPFFERRGFRLLEAQRVDIRGRRMTNFRMEKVLG